MHRHQLHQRAPSSAQSAYTVIIIIIIIIMSRSTHHGLCAQVDTPRSVCTSRTTHHGLCAQVDTPRHTTECVHKSTHHGVCAQVDTPRSVCTIDVASCRNSYCQSNRYTLLTHRVLAEPKMGLLRTWLLSVSENM